MSDIPPFCVYIHGCPGFHNVEISTELSFLIKRSEVLKMGENIDGIGTRVPWAELFAESMHHILLDAASDADQAKQHSWIFSDFRGRATLPAMKLPVEAYENAADSLGQPFVHVILRCKSERLNSYNRLGRSVPTTNVHEFSVFEEIWNVEEIRASRKANELEVDIGDMGAKEAAKMILDGISTILHF
ncbi:hypothetical protein TGAM01_v202196 [Trichoderma gamsii]|uniref:Uncharacterized protein n=1 Tax=Trichoderma gamsii TaxID=398673 RepID=A0A2P4ZXS2_9HYPO|nr:hypothetical protein TGAM01_v202196 [Trichoderma gamsii]PON29088.1 hypothetical protein TGAM01_v202196 [Trichoderma gamsii]